MRKHIQRAWRLGWPVDAGFVLLGGAAGTATRLVAAWAISAWLGHRLPYDVLLVNISGSFGLGQLAGLVPAEVRHRHPHWLLGAVGFLGAYTTFSSLALGSVQLLGSGRLLSGVLYPLASVVIGLMSVSAGDRAGALLLKRRRCQPAGAAQPSASIDDHDELKGPALPPSPS